MRVKELIKILSEQDQEMRIVVDAYELGFDESQKIRIVDITPNPKADIKTWEGDWDEVDPKMSYQYTEKALLIPRNS